MKSLFFNCSKCGACCKNVRRWKEQSSKLKEILDEEFVFPFDEIEGVCIHLDKNNECDIYDQRPDVCRTEYLYRLLHDRYDITVEEFFKLQTISCNLNKANISAKIDLKDEESG